jgi:large subunit ribosomal protein L30
MLRLEKNNTATLIKESSSYTGMLQKVKDYITWGEPSKENIKLLLEKRGKLIGDKKITDDALKELGYENIEKLSNALHIGEIEITQLNRIKPFFRMHPPKKGFKKTVKRPFKDRGELGYRGEAINELIVRMC